MSKYRLYTYIFAMIFSFSVQGQTSDTVLITTRPDTLTIKTIIVGDTLSSLFIVCDTSIKVSEVSRLSYYIDSTGKLVPSETDKYFYYDKSVMWVTGFIVLKPFSHSREEMFIYLDHKKKPLNKNYIVLSHHPLKNR